MNLKVQRTLVVLVVLVVIVSVFLSFSYPSSLAVNSTLGLDNTMQWEKIDNGLDNLHINALAINPNNSHVVYVGTDNGVYKSTNCGVSWTKIGLPNSPVSALGIAPSDPNVIYAGTWGNNAHIFGDGIYKSVNSGTSWSQTSLSEYYEVYHGGIAVSQSDSGTVYAAVTKTPYDYIIELTDGGAHYHSLASGLWFGIDFYAVAVSPSNPNIIYTGTSDGVYESKDSGKNWYKMGFGGTKVYFIVVSPSNPNIIYAGTDGSGVIKSTDGGNSWGMTGLKNGTVKSVAVSPSNTNIVYAGTYGNGVYKSKDSGTTWTQINVGLTDAKVVSVAVDPNNPDIAYAGTDEGGVFKYTYIPPAPKNLTASADATNKTISLMWQPPAQGKYPTNGYAIYRNTEKGKEYLSKPIATVDANTTQYTDKTAEIGKMYYYVVKVFDNQNPPNYSTPSNEVSIEIKDTTPPIITISSPEDGTETSDDFINVSGVITDDLSGIDSATINGNSLTLNPDGSFSTTVSLTKGNNTITITATDKVGNNAIKTITVTYKSKIVITLQPNNPMMMVNGVQQEIDPGRGTKPVIIPKWGRTVVPIRAIVEALGGTIEWDPVQRMVTINLNDNVINLWIGKPQARVNGKMKWIDDNNHDVKPIIVNSRTMLPLRFIAESLGCQVDWDGTTRTITITYTP